MLNSVRRYMKVFPNVKLNLGLKVLRRRPDGFHDIETLFIPYNGLHDTLEILPCDGETRFVADVPWDNDLTVQAYNLLKQDFDLLPVEIRLTKGAPVGAGLGSGSADAAFTLRMLNEMFALGLGDEALAAYASRLGSDCAFFIYNRPMMGTGRGEVLSPFDIDLSRYEIRVVTPDIHVSTKEAYGGIVPRERREEGEGEPLADVLKRPVEEWKGALENDFEATVFARHPEIAAIKDDFYAQGALFAAMSGSGSSVFGIFAR